MSAASWNTIERALQAWVVEGSGLAGDHVVWNDLKLAQPTKPYISLAFVGERGVGSDEVITRDAASPQAGAEIEHVVRGNRVALLSITVYVTSADAVGERAARAILDDVRTQRSVPDTADALGDAGIGVANIESTRAVGIGIDSADIEPRVVMTVACNIGSTLVRTGTYIQSAEITNETTGETFDAPASDESAGTAAGTSTASGAAS